MGQARTMSATAVYARVSSEEQRERQSIQTQIQFAANYLQLHGTETWATYLDDGVTGTIPLEDRPGGAQLLAAVRAGQVKTVYVYKLDRFGREIRIILNAMHQLEQAGCALVSMTESFETVTPAGRAMLGMLAVFAGFERDQMQARIREGYERSSRIPAKFNGGPRPPFGYAVEGKAHTARLVINEEEAGFVRLAFQLSVEERKSCREIAAHFNALRVPTPFASADILHPKTRLPVSGVWTGEQVARLLRNSAYRGIRYHNKRSKRPLQEQECPAIVPADVWEAAEAQIVSGRNGKNRVGDIVYLLRGLMVCHICGRKFHGWPRSERVQYYKCHGLARPPKCGARLVPRAPAEAEVWTKVQRRIRQLRAAMMKDATQLELRTEDRALETGLVLRLIDAKAAERDRLLRLYRRGQIGDAEIDAQLAEVDQEQAALTARWEAIKDEMPEPVRSARDLITEIDAELKAGTETGKQRAIALLIERIDVVTQDGEMPRLEIRWR